MSFKNFIESMSEAEREEFKESVNRSLLLANAAFDIIKKRDVRYEFPCPNCGGHAHGLRVSINGHLHAQCDDCGSYFHQ